LRALIIGLGSIGRRHLDNLRSLDEDIEVTIWRQSPNARDADEIIPGVDSVVYDAASALAVKPEVALITGPAPWHVETAMTLARNGIDLFIEKPLADSPRGVEELLGECERRSLVLMVGYNFRFCQSMLSLRDSLTSGVIGSVLAVRAEVGQFLPDWRPGADYRTAVSARANLGGGVVLELSHELDYIRWLVGEVEAVSAWVGRVSDLEIDVEDMAEITLRFRSGAIGNVHLDMIQRSPVRTCRVIGSEGTLLWDGISHRVDLYSARTQNWSNLYEDENMNCGRVMYIEEIRHFLDCVKKRQTPLVTGEDGLRALEIALAAKRSSADGREVLL
jgi:predicted dehydrogenase